MASGSTYVERALTLAGSKRRRSAFARADEAAVVQAEDAVREAGRLADRDWSKAVRQLASGTHIGEDGMRALSLPVRGAERSGYEPQICLRRSLRGVVIYRYVSIMAFALAGCSDATPRRASPVVIPPNSGTAPDWLAICAGQAHRAFGVAYDAIHVDRQIVDRADGIRVAEGHYDVPVRQPRYRCLVDRHDRFVRIENLPSSVDRPSKR